MENTEIFEKIGESLGSTASVRSVFGEPIQTQGKTVVPVAKVAYGFGAGGGSRPGRHDTGKHENGSGDTPQGGGGGGGVRAFPAGALEITPTGTRFIAYRDSRWAIGAFAAGVVVGRLFTRRRS